MTEHARDAGQVTYLKDLVAARLARRGLLGTVAIYPSKPLAVRLATGERTQFVVEYRGTDTVRLLVDEWEVSCGTVGASVADALARRIEKARSVDLAA